MVVVCCSTIIHLRWRSVL